MPRIISLLPSREVLLASRWLRPFRHHLGTATVWRWNRRAVARGVALGLVIGIIVPVMKLPLVAVLAVVARANVVVAALCTLFTNPLVTPAIYFAAYQLGTTVIDVDPQAGMVGGSGLDRLLNWLASASLPTALGLLLLAGTAAAIGFVAVHQSWRLGIMRRWLRRARGRAAWPAATAADSLVGG